MRNLKGAAAIARLGRHHRRRRDLRARSSRGDGPALGRPRCQPDDRPIRRSRRWQSARRRAACAIVRPGGTEAIEVADAKFLNAVDIPASEWRDPIVMGVATFQVAAVTIKRPGARLIRAERGRRGRWRLRDPLTRARPDRQDREPARGARLASGRGRTEGVCRRRRS